jgi:hypothetical protein
VTFQYNDEGGRRRHRPWYARNRLLVVAIVLGVVAVGALGVAIARGSTSKHDAAAETQGRTGAPSDASSPSAAGKGKKSTSRTTLRGGGTNGAKNGSSDTVPAGPGGHNSSSAQQSPPATAVGPGGPQNTTSTTLSPEEKAAAQAYVSAYRGECQKVWAHADADGLLWDPDDHDAGSHTINECYNAMDPLDETLYGTVPDATDYAVTNADGVIEDMTIGNRLQSSSGFTFNAP